MKNNTDTVGSHEDVEFVMSNVQHERYVPPPKHRIL